MTTDAPPPARPVAHVQTRVLGAGAVGALALGALALGAAAIGALAIGRLADAPQHPTVVATEQSDEAIPSEHILMGIDALARNDSGMPDDRTHIRRLHRAPEAEVLAPLLPLATSPPGVDARARSLVHAARAAHRPGADVTDFLAEYGLGTAEGVALLCLAEALLRIPDAATADALIEDRIAAADWQKHLGHGESLAVNASAWAFMLTGRVLALDDVGGVIGSVIRRHRRAGDPHRAASRHAHAGAAVRHGPHDRGGAGARRPALALQLRHAGRGGEDACRCGTLPARLSRCDRRHRSQRGRARTDRRAGHFGQALGAASALRAVAGRALRARTDRHADRSRACGEGRGHRAHRRCGGGRPAGDQPRHLRRRAGRPAACRLGRARSRRAGVPEARASPDRLGRRTGSAHAAPHPDTAGEGRLLGQRDQAGAGAGPCRLSGVHPQGRDRCELARLRAPHAGMRRCDLPRVRHAQRAQSGVRPGMRGCGRVRDAAPARHGRGAVPRCDVSGAGLCAGRHA